jgi:hypothetical protein
LILLIAVSINTTEQNGERIIRKKEGKGGGYEEE